jgi:hypothetical protein
MDSDTGTNIWTVDNATIRTEIGQRNVLRQSALLPLLDEQQEFDHACRVIRSKRWHAFCESKQADYERFREEVMAGRRAPSGYIGAWGLNLEVHKRFKAFLLEAVSKLWQEVLKSAASGESEASAIPGDYDVDPRDPGRA